MSTSNVEESARPLAERARAIRRPPKRGDIFRQLRNSLIAGDVVEAGRLQSQLTQDMCENIRLLYRYHQALGEALDDILPFTGFWSTFKPGTLSRILRLKCDEVSDRNTFGSSNL